jgi:predicted nucleic acid-binding protein
MTRYVIDSYAWIEYLRGSAEGDVVRKIVENKDNDILTVSVSIAEVISAVKRENKDHDAAFRHMISLSKIIDTTPDISKETGIFHAEKRKRIRDFGLADSFVAVVAEHTCANILTGDTHFRGMKNVVFL